MQRDSVLRQGWHHQPVGLLSGQLLPLPPRRWAEACPGQKEKPIKTKSKTPDYRKLLRVTGWFYHLAWGAGFLDAYISRNLSNCACSIRVVGCGLSPLMKAAEIKCGFELALSLDYIEWK